MSNCKHLQHFVPLIHLHEKSHHVSEARKALLGPKAAAPFLAEMLLTWIAAAVVVVAAAVVGVAAAVVVVVACLLRRNM